MSTEQLIPLEEAAAEFGVHRSTIFRHLTEGRLARHTRMGDRRTFVDRWQMQRLVEDPAVQRCLQEIYDRFRPKSEWPVAREIQRELDRGPGPGFDFLAAIEALPQELGWRVRDMEGRAQLTLRGIARCENSGDDVSAFLALMRACYERYLGDEALEVTSSQLGQAFGFDAPTLERLFLTTQVEAGFWTSLGKNQEGWSVTLDSERLRHFRDIGSVADYLAAKQRAYQPRQAPVARFMGQLAPAFPAGSSAHPAIAAAVATLRDTPAVIAAAAATEAMMGERLGDGTRHGAALISRYFDAALRASPTDARRLEQLRALGIAAFGAYRNLAAHGRMAFVGAQAAEIVGMFSLLAREVEAIPMPFFEVRDTIPWVPFRQADAATLSAFLEAGGRSRAWKLRRPNEVPVDWFCDVHQGFLDRADIGIAYGEGIEPSPVCPNEGCPGRGWIQVHTERTVPSVQVGGGGQSPTRIGRGPRKERA